MLSLITAQDSGPEHPGYPSPCVTAPSLGAELGPDTSQSKELNSGTELVLDGNRGSPK